MRRREEGGGFLEVYSVRRKGDLQLMLVLLKDALPFNVNVVKGDMRNMIDGELERRKARIE